MAAPTAAEVNALVALVERGRHAEAELQARRFAARHPRESLGWKALAICLQQLGRGEEAIAAMRKAVENLPHDADLRYDLGVYLGNRGDLAAAEASYRSAIALRPDFGWACGNLANTLRAMGRPAEAVDWYRRAIALEPRQAATRFNLGCAFKDIGRTAEAESCFREALTLQPGFAEAHGSLGHILKDRGQPGAAEASYRSALALRPNQPEFHVSLGLVVREQLRSAEAEACYRRALALDPDNLDALNNLGQLLIDLERPAEAEACLRRALQIKPDFFVACANLAHMLKNQGRLDEVLACCRHALELSPSHAETHYILGSTLYDMNRLPEAEASLRKAMELESDHARAHFTHALCRLRAGDYEQGFKGYEWCWKIDPWAAAMRSFPAPLWLGEGDIAGKTILLHAEQGLGDSLQFSRYAAMVAERGARVILEVHRPLAALMKTLRGVDTLVVRGEPLPGFDLHCPLPSLPLAFDTRLESVPAPVPYLQADPQRVAAWGRKLGPGKPRVGLVWAGRPGVETDRHMSFAQIAPLLEVAGIEFHSLQVDEGALAQLREHPARQRIIDHSGELHDLADTAALLAQLDLLVSVDTSVPHLAGALGRPFWLLNRYNTCWTWAHRREDSPWYPTARIFRQPAFGDWDSVIDRVADELAAWAGK